MHDTITEPAPSLVDSAVAGDQSALRALWENNRRWVAAVILSHKPRSADLDDLLQDVALTLLAKISTLQDPANFKPWLRMIALNAARLAGRKHAALPRKREFDPENDGHLGSSADAPSHLAESSRRLLDLAMELDEDYREPLILRAIHELSYRQISAILDLPETTVETRIARARRMLRERAEAQPQPIISPLHATGSASSRIS